MDNYREIIKSMNDSKNLNGGNGCYRRVRKCRHSVKPHDVIINIPTPNITNYIYKKDCKTWMAHCMNLPFLSIVFMIYFALLKISDNI